MIMIRTIQRMKKMMIVIPSSSPNHNKPTEECVEPRISALDEELLQDPVGKTWNIFYHYKRGGGANYNQRNNDIDSRNTSYRHNMILKDMSNLVHIIVGEKYS